MSKEKDNQIKNLLNNLSRIELKVDKLENELKHREVKLESMVKNVIENSGLLDIIKNDICNKHKKDYKILKFKHNDINYELDELNGRNIYYGIYNDTPVKLENYTPNNTEIIKVKRLYDSSIFEIGCLIKYYNNSGIDIISEIKEINYDNDIILFFDGNFHHGLNDVVLIYSKEEYAINADKLYKDKLHSDDDMIKFAKYILNSNNFALNTTMNNCIKELLKSFKKENNV